MSRSYELPDAILLQAQVDEAEVIIDKLQEENEFLLKQSITTHQQLKLLKEALEFTVKAAEHLFQPDKELKQGLCPSMYHTLDYAGDLELIMKTKAARKLLEDLK